jgi:hypothetical protein
MIRNTAVLAALIAAFAVSPATAQQGQPAADDKVVVQGKSAEDAVRDFVAEVGVTPDGTNMARWGDTVCVGVYNLAPKYAQQMIDQVSLVGAAIGVEPGGPGCKANVLIMADVDGDALAARLVDDHIRKFLPPATDGADLGREALRKFKTSDAPVRWWHVGQTVLVDTGEAIARGDTVRVRGAGRLRDNVRQDMSHIVIILDASRIGTVSFASLSDYVAMVALSQVDADADTREYSTVLNLFNTDTGARTARMTQWDLDYLTALYETAGDASSPGREANHIARKMLQQSGSGN